jgi:hypothetical protein
MSKTQTDRLKSERLQTPMTRLKSERLQSTVVIAEVAVASQSPGLAPAAGDEVTVKVAGRRRLRSGSGEETVADFAMKIK